MRDSKQPSIMLAGLVVSALVVVFGAYIFQQKTILPLQTGLTPERIGIVEQASDPGYFWFSVCFYGAISAAIVIAGLAYPVSLLRRKR